eukprot:TRINITY_DN2492_c0_g1_i1.p1 TRINITY_DN2492_c0_g1~~TRINITY_DN2492_c0_g1_i1.p1  ORF type:complete len:309 (+),score=64.49 TRINITY_DN2492_c0_g1_i1:83-928(+)
MAWQQPSASGASGRRILGGGVALLCAVGLVTLFAPRNSDFPEVHEFGSDWAPTCRYLPGDLEWQPGSLVPPPGTLCTRPGRQQGSFTCHESHHGVPKPGDSGAWELGENYAYFIDLGLASHLSGVFANSSVLELGSGKGCYSAYLTGSGKGIRVTAVDGAPGITRLTRGAVTQHDLTVPAAWAPRDWVMCLEVAVQGGGPANLSTCPPPTRTLSSATCTATTPAASCSPGPCRGRTGGGTSTSAPTAMSSPRSSASATSTTRPALPHCAPPSPSSRGSAAP